VAVIQKRTLADVASSDGEPVLISETQQTLWLSKRVLLMTRSGPRSDGVRAKMARLNFIALEELAEEVRPLHFVFFLST
jgi:hypothetical protein